jgi:hypothetical protein
MIGTVIRATFIVVLTSWIPQIGSPFSRSWRRRAVSASAPFSPARRGPSTGALPVWRAPPPLVSQRLAIATTTVSRTTLVQWIATF